MKPDWAPANGIDYDNLVRSWRYEVVAWLRTGEYQGDYWVILRKFSSRAYRYGFLVIGYGSCSGCDALEAAVTYAPGATAMDWGKVEEHRTLLHDGIHWGDSAEELATWLEDRDPAVDWWVNDREGRHVISGFVSLLRSISRIEVTS